MKKIIKKMYSTLPQSYVADLPEEEAEFLVKQTRSVKGHITTTPVTECGEGSNHSSRLEEF